MAVSITLDLTAAFTASQSVVQDVGGFDYAVLQIVNASAAIDFKQTNDSGGVQGVSDGSALTATNFVAAQGLKMSDGTSVTSATAGLYKFLGGGQFLQFSKAAATVDKLILRLYKTF